MSSMSSELKTNFGSRFVRNTFIGFDEEEIKTTSTEDLLLIRGAVYGYLSSKKLKRRNANFKEVFERISEELADRKVLPKRSGFHLHKKNAKFLVTNKSQPSTKSDSDYETCEKTFLKRKHMMDIEIPSFLNDKEDRSCETLKKKFIYEEKEIKMNNSKNLLESSPEKTFSDFFSLPLCRASDFNLPLYDSMDFERDLKELEIITKMYSPEEKVFNFDFN